jgi:acetyltransferase-like isoleucine patch superfamily enzyme
LGIRIGSGVILARNTVLSCKDGNIGIGDQTNISMNCLIHSEHDVQLGSNILIAAYCYLVGGGSHDFERTDVPIIQQESVASRGIVLEDGVWLAARVTVLDGVRIGKDAVIGAGAVVRDDVPALGIAVGMPARVVRLRGAKPA